MPGGHAERRPSSPCPCCGGRMIIIETFERGGSAAHAIARRRDQDRHLMMTDAPPRTAAQRHVTIAGPARRPRWRSDRATTLYSVGPRTRTMMQSCASAAKLRGGGPILPVGMKAKGASRVTATSNRHRQTPSSSRQAPKLVVVPSASSRSLCRTQDDAIRHLARRHQPPQGDQQLARQATIMVLRVPPRAVGRRA